MRLLFSFSVFRCSDDGRGRRLVGLAVLALEQVLALQAGLDQLFLQLAEAVELGGDGVQGGHDAVAQLGFHAPRSTGRAPSSKSSSSSSSPSALGLRRRSAAAGLAGRRARLCGSDDGVQAAVGGVQVDDFAQQDAAVGQFLAPDHDGFEGQGAFAQTADHGVAAGLDALGDGDFALAAQQLDRAHLAQVHAHRVVGAVIGGSLAGVSTTAVSSRDGHLAARRRRLPRPRRR